MTNYKKIVVGSNAFFSSMPGFNPHDNDVLLLEDNPTEYDMCMHIMLYGNCYFKWKRTTPEVYIDWHKKSELGMTIGKFLIPEFVHEIGFTIEHLKQLQHLVDKLDDKHLYEKVIYDSYIENNDFILTPEQLQLAYDTYLKHKKSGK